MGRKGKNKGVDIVSYKQFGTIVTIIGLILIFSSFHWGYIVAWHHPIRSDAAYTAELIIYPLMFMTTGLLISWVGLKILLNEFFKK